METTNLIVHFLIFTALLFIKRLCKTENCDRLINDDGGFTSKPIKLIRTHLLGIIIMGLIPVIILKYSLIKVLTDNTAPSDLLIAFYFSILILIIVIALYQSRKSYKKNENTPESFVCFSSAFFICYFIVRTLFLFAYELWFRGFLLFDCIDLIGIPAAVSVNTILYVLAHTFKSRKEILACIPFGILVCLLCIAFNATWPAVILHIAFSLTYEITYCQFKLNIVKTAES